MGNVHSKISNINDDINHHINDEINIDDENTEEISELYKIISNIRNNKSLTLEMKNSISFMKHSYKNKIILEYDKIISNINKNTNK